MAQFVRGFKSYCSKLVQGVRAELGLHESMPIDMDNLAKHLCIDTAPLSELVDATSVAVNAEHLEEVYDKVSAFTIFEGVGRVVIYNDRHSPPRHRSNLAHEFAHALLQHPPEGAAGSAAKERLHENEAGWLAGVLLLTDVQAVHIAKNRLSAGIATAQFAISHEMLRYRLQVTGALKRFPYASV